MRRPAALTKSKPRVARTTTFPAPVGGWIRNQNLAIPDARLPDGGKISGAFVLDNWFPEATGLRMRRGSQSFAQVGDGIPTVSLFSYVNGLNAKLFATTETAIYDITSPALPEHEVLADEQGRVLVDEQGRQLLSRASVASASVSSLQGGEWSVVQFATPGGVFLRAVNGIDTPLVFDGSSWAQTPAITGVDPATLSYVWMFRRRLFFIKGGSLSAFYLPADSIGGAVTEIPFGGVFERGGSLLYGASWSLESGAGGLSEQCVFITTEGEVAVYQGTDPSNASTWSKVGVYRIGRPLGPKAFIRAGGDLVIATDIGFIPLTQAIQRDLSALSPSAVSYRVEMAWNDAVRDTASSGSWHCAVWPGGRMVMVAPPTPIGGQPQVLVANARTGAWSRYTGWRATCVEVFKDRLVFGSTDGLIIEGEVTGSDRGQPYTATVVPLFDPLKSPASLKTSLTARATLMSSYEIVPRLSLQADYALRLPAVPDDDGISSSNVWDSAVWGSSVWSEPATRNVYQRWQSVGGSGYAIAPSAQITSGKSIPPDVELVKIDITYDQGDIGS